ncbi:SAM-dependent methyltransferase [Chloroflexota bacterium]
MDFLELFDISERYMEIINPSTLEKLMKIGDMLDLDEKSRIIDFGCGYGEQLALWAEKYGISGTGIDIRQPACDRARKKMHDRGLDGRIEIACSAGAEYPFEKHSFDVALCVGATFIWDGYKAAIPAMKEAVRAGGRLVIGEPYWLKGDIPPEYSIDSHTIYTEYELLQIAREAGYDFEYVVRSSQDDWDRYESGNWHGLIRWLEENPDHPERQDVIDRLHQSQDEYLKFGREYLGWAIYILNPVKY